MCENMLRYLLRRALADRGAPRRTRASTYESVAKQKHPFCSVDVDVVYLRRVCCLVAEALKRESVARGA